MKHILTIAILVLLGSTIVFVSCQKELFCEVCSDNNKSPIAFAGPDIAITLPTDSILLDGNKSNDPDGTITIFGWTKISGPGPSIIVTANTATTIVNNLSAGVYQFELKVTDAAGLSAKDTVQVMVDDPRINQPPVARAGTDTIIVLPANTVTLDAGGSSDPDNNITGYTWTKIAGPSSFAITNATGVLTPVTDLVGGTYQFEIEVTDAGGLSAKDTVRVMVDDPSTNQPPVARAGPDTSIWLPTNAVNLDGSGSSDPDNNITSYAWAKISGPATFSIINANSVQTQVINLIQGTYQFEMKVTDADGLVSKDTIQVIMKAHPQLPLACDNSYRPKINVQLIPVGNLSRARSHMDVATAGNKILFAGGVQPGSNYSSRVDIYDMPTQSIFSAELCVARGMTAAIGSGNKIFFAGGEYGDGTWPVDSVDIYDVTTNSWSVTHLSTSGNGIAAATVGNKVFFAGGDHGFNATNGIDRTRQVDIYDLVSGRWSTAQLSEGKRLHSAVALNNKVYFAGGETWSLSPGNRYPYASNKVDVFDNDRNTWSTITMYEGKLGSAGIAVAGKIYWSGGSTGTHPTSLTNSCVVEIKDVHTGLSEITSLSTPGGGLSIFKNDRIIFFRDGKEFDIYNIITKSWSIGVLPVNIEGASVISVNETIYVAGGNVNGVLSNQIWKLEI